MATSVIDFFFFFSSFKHFVPTLRRQKTQYSQQLQSLYGHANPDILSQVLERMDEIVPRASEITKLPMHSVNYSLDLLRDLYYARQEVPDILRQFIGASRQSKRSSLLLLSNSLVNKGGKIHRQISQDGLLKFSKEWFANLVMAAAFSFLDPALRMWKSMRSGNHCIHFSATSKPHEIWLARFLLLFLSCS